MDNVLEVFSIVIFLILFIHAIYLFMHNQLRIEKLLWYLDMFKKNREISDKDYQSFMTGTQDSFITWSSILTRTTSKHCMRIRRLPVRETQQMEDSVLRNCYWRLPFGSDFTYTPSYSVDLTGANSYICRIAVFKLYLREKLHRGIHQLSGHFFFDMERLTILILLVITACKPTENSVTGTYSRYWDFENHSKLTLNGDKTFGLEAQEGLVFFQTSGTWTIDKNELVLNSFQNSSQYLKSVVTDKGTTDKKGVTLKVKDNEGAELPGAPIYVYTNGQEKKFSADVNGELNISTENWDSIKVSFVGFNPLTIHQGQENWYDIRLNLSEPIGVKLKNERWTMSNRKIFDPRFKEQRRRNVYRKIAR
jgi:hypothetical protein